MDDERLKNPNYIFGEEKPKQTLIMRYGFMETLEQTFINKENCQKQFLHFLIFF